MQPVGANLGKPSLLVRMESKKNGPVMRIFQLFESDGTPFTGTVQDVVADSNNVWTCDDTRSKYGHPPPLCMACCSAVYLMAVY